MATNEGLENFEKLVERSKRGEIFLTMADIYRKARTLWQLQDFKFDDGTKMAPDHKCLSVAVNVARWFPIVGALECTEYGTVKLVWRHVLSYLSIEFFPDRVKTFKLINKNYRDVHEQVQYCGQQVGVDMLWAVVAQFCAESGSPTDLKPVLYDNFEGTEIPDLDMALVEKKEQEVLDSIRRQLGSQKTVEEDGNNETETEVENPEDIFSNA